jgi:hypothetical protein
MLFPRDIIPSEFFDIMLVAPSAKKFPMSFLINLADVPITILFERKPVVNPRAVTASPKIRIGDDVTSFIVLLIRLAGLKLSHVSSNCVFNDCLFTDCLASADPIAFLSSSEESVLCIWNYLSI